MKEPLISVIVPCFNQAIYLNEALESVKNQSYSNWECIIINDGSKDQTEEFALKWAKMDERFKYLKQENKGVSAARNYAIECAKGKFILPLDADDKLSDNYIESCLKLIDDNVRIVYGKTMLFGNKTGELNLGIPTLKNLLKFNRIHCSGVYFKEDWLLNNGYDLNMNIGFEDWEFWLNILKRGGQVKKSEEAILFYRVVANSRSHSINNNLTAKNKMQDYILIKHIDLYGYNSLFDIYLESKSHENKIDNIHKHITVKEIIKILLKKMQLVFNRFKSN